MPAAETHWWHMPDTDPHTYWTEKVEEWKRITIELSARGETERANWAAQHVTHCRTILAGCKPVSKLATPTHRRDLGEPTKQGARFSERFRKPS